MQKPSTNSNHRKEFFSQHRSIRSKGQIIKITNSPVPLAIYLEAILKAKQQGYQQSSIKFS